MEKFPPPKKKNQFSELCGKESSFCPVYDSVCLSVCLPVPIKPLIFAKNFDERDKRDGDFFNVTPDLDSNGYFYKGMSDYCNVT